MPFTDESVLFREKEGGGYGGDPTWIAEAIVWILALKGGGGVGQNGLRNREHSGRKYCEDLKASRAGGLAR